MPLDPNIILQGQMPQIASPLDTMTKAMTLKQLSQQGQLQDQQFSDQQSLRDAFKAGVTTNPDGTSSINRGLVMSYLNQNSPKLAYDYGVNFKKQDREDSTTQMDLLSKQIKTQRDLTWGMYDEPSYQANRAVAIQLGLPNASRLPPQYDPQFVKAMQAHFLEPDKQADQANKDREFQLKNKELGIKQENVSIKRDSAQADKVDKFTKSMKDDLDADKGRAGNFGQISAKIQSADRLKTLIAAFKGGNLPAAQIEELALGAANMIAPNNGGSRAQVEALVPHSVMGDNQKLMSWLLNEPLGANQQKFVEMMDHTIDRERSVSNDQLNQIRASRLSAHGRLKQLAPDVYNNVLQGYGIDPTKVVNGKYQASPASSSVRMQAPDGTVRLVPADQAEAAKAAGGKVLDGQ